jgi:hypothetical protein
MQVVPINQVFLYERMQQHATAVNEDVLARLLLQLPHRLRLRCG